jgi:hypothetical protein
MNDNNIVIEATPDRAFDLENKKLDLEAGWLGGFFGTGTNAPANIAGLTVIVLLVAGIAISWFETKMPPLDYWKTAAPIITLALGYLFGRKS